MSHMSLFKSFQPGRSVHALVALLVCASAACAAAITGRALVGQPAPQMALNALDGRDMSAASARGHYLLITFSDAKSKDAGSSFFRAHAPRFAQVPGIVMHNVIVPGGVLLAPRGVILSRIKSDAARLEREVRAGLKPDEQRRFDAAELRWHVDFDRRYTALFGAPAHRVTLALVAPDGVVVAYEDAVDAAVVDRLVALTASSNAPAPRAPAAR